MTHLVRTATVLVVLALSGACEKSDSTIEGSGELSDSERTLMGYLGAGSNLVFGGNYDRLMKYWETSPLRTLSESVMATAGNPNGMRDYMTCWVEQQHATDLMGSLEARPGAMSMTMVFRGITEKILTTCADRGGLEYRRDPDGKYIELKGLSDGRGGTANVGYYFVAPDTAFFSFELPVGFTGGGPLPMPDRAELEARVARAKAAPAADSAEFKALLAKADRSRPFWFSGSSAGTPLADKVGAGHGWLDADKDSLTFAFAVELDDAATAARAVSQFADARKSVAMLPPDLKQPAEAFLADAKLTASGKTLNGRFRLTNDVLNKALPAIQGLAGGGF
jgi:hypothetical protein